MDTVIGTKTYITSSSLKMVGGGQARAEDLFNPL